MGRKKTGIGGPKPGTVAAMKAALRALELDTTGTKAVLQERIKLKNSEKVLGY